MIHANFSYPTVHGILPDPFFRIYLDNIHKDKHGSDTGAYDNEGRFIPQKFEDFFAKYASQKDGLAVLDIWNGLRGQRVIMDPIGWGAEMFECSYHPYFYWMQRCVYKLTSAISRVCCLSIPLAFGRDY